MALSDLGRDSYNRQSFGPTLHGLVKDARVLMVGAGGIGCELLKNLVLEGFGKIHIVDLDTIDLSNLNRQFLFRQQHIKKPKALVAKEVAQAFNPKVKIEAHFANIKDEEFNVEWYQTFKIVFNALDNLDARRHVNKMCLAAGVPLIESGTTGFNGQVQVVKKGVTACYDCSPKEVPKSFPICTIRSTPSQPIHCIVWAKSYLLNEIFGVGEDETAFDHSEDADNREEIEELKKQAEALRQIRESVGTAAFPQLLFDLVFQTDVKRLLSMEDLWKSRQKPETLDYKTVNSKLPTVDQAFLQNDQVSWSLEENLAVWNDSLDRLSKRVAKMKKDGASQSTITFDKDDQDTLDFVSAAANIRSHIFGIDLKSRFDIKQMAGNIIPAIATTNAIVSALCVLQAHKVLKGEFDKAKEVFLTPFAPQRLLASDRPREPNPDCLVCSSYYTMVQADLERATLKDLVDDFVRTHLGYGDRDLSVYTDAGLVYEPADPDDPDEPDNLLKKLTELSIRQGSFITIKDDGDEDTFVNVVVYIQEAKEDVGDKPVKAKASGPDKPVEIPRKPKKVPMPESHGSGQINGKHGLEGNDTATRDLKRSREDSPGHSSSSKKAKIKAPENDTVVVDDDAGSYIYVIDDD